MKVKAVIVFSLFTLVSTPVATFADLKPEDAITYRQSAMMFMRWNMGKIKKQVAENPETYNKQQVIAAANVIAAIANSGLGVLFAENTNTGKGWHDTKVKPEYFKEPEEVEKHAKKFIVEANALVEVANRGETSAIKDQFETLFKACKSCHKKYREKEKE